MVMMLNSANKHSKGQFFSFDVIAGSVIFLFAFFLLAFYWLNAQAQIQDHSNDMQRDAQRIADQLMTSGESYDWYSNWLSSPGEDNLDDVVLVKHMHLVGDPSTPNVVDFYLFRDLNTMSSVGSFKYQAEVKEKLGIPRYNYYITLEDANGDVLWCRLPGSSFSCEAPVNGEPPADAREVANAERIILFDNDLSNGPDEPELVKLRVQVWRP